MRSCLSILLGKEAAGLLALTAAFFGCRYVVSSSTPEPVHFKSTREFKDFAGSKGIYLHSGSMNGGVRGNFFVADHPLTLDDLEDLQSRRDCGITPAWRGILWVCAMNNSLGTLCADQMGGKWRVWGNVLVAGDEDLMDRMESLYRNK